MARAIHEDIHAAEKRTLAAVDAAEIDGYLLAHCTPTAHEDHTPRTPCTADINDEIRAIHAAWQCPTSTDYANRWTRERGSERVRAFRLGGSTFHCPDYWTPPS